MSKGKHKKLKKALLVSALTVAVIAVTVASINFFSVQHLLKTGNEYNKVEIENQLVPQKDENGNACAW